MFEIVVKNDLTKFKCLLLRHEVFCVYFDVLGLQNKVIKLSSAFHQQSPQLENTSLGS